MTYMVTLGITFRQEALRWAVLLFNIKSFLIGSAQRLLIFVVLHKWQVTYDSFVIPIRLSGVCGW